MAQVLTLRTNGERPYRLGLGVPYHSSISLRTCMSLIGTLRRYNGELFGLAQQGPYLHFNREDILQKAIETKCSHLWFCDTDMDFDPDGLEKLVKLDKDVCGASYNYKQTPTRPVIKFLAMDGTLSDITPDLMPREPFQCAVIPTGFMLIRLEALEDLQPPFFECIKPVGEDTFFCNKLRVAGIEIWCDQTIRVGHIGEASY